MKSLEIVNHMQVLEERYRLTSYKDFDYMEKCQKELEDFKKKEWITSSNV